MKRFASLAVAAACAAMSLPAAAQFAKPEDAIKYRQSSLFVMSQHFGRLGAMAIPRPKQPHHRPTDLDCQGFGTTYR